MTHSAVCSTVDARGSRTRRSGSHLWGDRRLLVFQRTDAPLHFSAQVQNTERLIDPHYCFTVYAAPSPSRALQLRK